MPRWRFVLRNSKDLSKIDELTQARGRSVELLLGKSGTAKFNHPMSHDVAAAIQPWNTCISAERYNWRATKAMWEGDSSTRGRSIWDWIWSGSVLNVDESWHADTMAVNCVGWGERFAFRQFRRDKTWNAMDDGAILQDVLAEMNMSPAPDGYTIPTVAGSSPATPTWMQWGGTVPNEGVGGATAYVARTSAPISAPITLKRSRNTFAMTVVDDLINLEYGGDWWVHPVTRHLYWARKRCVVRPDVIIAFRASGNNVAEFNRQLAAEQKANYFVTTGGTGTTPQFAHDTADQAINGLIEQNAALSDIVNNNVLLANSGIEIILRKNGRITYGINPFPYQGDINRPVGSAPEPFVDYGLGDELKVVARSPRGVRGQVAQMVRVHGMSVTIDENNNEKLGQLQVAP